MWPFNPKPRDTVDPLETAAQKANIEAVAAITAWRDVGQEFIFLGRQMVVSQIGKYESWPGYPFTRIVLVPQLTAVYVDDAGVVRSHTFNEREVFALMRTEGATR